MINLTKYHIVQKIEADVEFNGEIKDNLEKIWSAIVKPFEDALFSNIEGECEKFLTITKKGDD